MSRAVGVILAVIGLLVSTQYFIGRRAPRQGKRGPGGETVLRMRRFRYASLSTLALAPGAIVAWIVLTLRPTPNDWGAVLLASGLVTACTWTGLWCLAQAQGQAALSPWAMALPFGVGQLVTAGVLYWALERAHEQA